jgi:hypothetical protein
MNSELVIEDAIISDTESVGFPGASAIRRVRVSPDSGVVDLMLIPAEGAVKLVLIEVKDMRNREASSKVTGQLLMYYGGALQLGHQGLERIREFAEAKADVARAKGKISLNKLAGTSPTPAAWSILQSGPKLSPSDIRLIIALNGDPSPGLSDALRAVREHHGLCIDVAVLGTGGVQLVDVAV